MKKIIALLLALATLCTMLIACNGNGNTETTTANNGTTTTTTNNNDGTTTTVEGGNEETTTTVENANDETTTLPTTDPTGETTTTVANETTTISETTTTVAETTSTTPEGTTIFNSAWGPFDTYDINTGERYTANMFKENKVTVTYLTTITCSICKAWMKSYMNQLRTELEAKGAKVVVILVFAGEHYSEEGKVASIIEEYKAWYKANNGDYPFIAADDNLQKKVKWNSVPLLYIWVGGSQGGRNVAQFHGTYADPTGGYSDDELYKKINDAVDFWLTRA